tara:strand:- start:445 stop:1056 length:612 start_codon:yes stop_codon:yes gene_type:complete
MKISIIYKAILLFNLLFIISVESNERVEHKIAVLVNEELITSYDIIQRMKLSALLQNIEITEENNQLLLNNTVDELVHEKLKNEKIQEYNISIEENEYLEFESNFYKRNNLDKELVFNLLNSNNINLIELERLLKNQLSWNKLVNGLFFRLTSVSDLEIDEVISKNPNITIDQARNIVTQRQLDLKSGKMMRDMLNEATIEYK